MTTVPSGEASIPTRGDSRSSDSPAVGSQSQGSLPADGPVARSAASAEQDVDEASTAPAASKATSESGDEGRPGGEAAAGHRQEPKAATAQLAHPRPDALPVSMSLHSLVWAGSVRDLRTTQSLRVSQSDSLVKIETPQTASVPDREQGLDPSTPSAEVQFPQNVPTMSIADADRQLDTRATGPIEAIEKSEGPEAVNPDTEALPSAESQAVTEGDWADRSGDLQARPVPPPTRNSGPPLPGAPTVARRRRPLDSSLYMATERNNYLSSMTSLLGGGEGSISSLADILVWSEATMGIATGLLATGHSSMSDLLQSLRPSLHSVSSILGNAGSALSSGLVAGTGSVLRSVTHALERMEQRTAEGVRLAACYVAGRLAPLWPQL